MRKTIYLILVIVIFACTNQKQVENRAQAIFNNNILVIEKYLKGETIEGTGLNDSVLFLEGLTGIKSDIFEGIDKLLDPTEKNLQDWKNWYKNNKNLIYWDEKEKKVRLKEN